MYVYDYIHILSNSLSGLQSHFLVVGLQYKFLSEKQIIAALTKRNNLNPVEYYQTWWILIVDLHNFKNKTTCHIDSIKLNMPQTVYKVNLK